MYKSHFDGSYIGFSETEIEVADGESLLIRYTPPMLAMQPGNIIISDYTGEAQIHALLRDMDASITKGDMKREEQKEEAKKNSGNFVKIFVVLMVLSAVIGLLYWFIVMNSF